MLKLLANKLVAGAAVAVVASTAGVAVAFGADLSAGQIAAVTAEVGSISALAAALVKAKVDSTGGS